jgi:hypothetical protein
MPLSSLPHRTTAVLLALHAWAAAAAAPPSCPERNDVAAPRVGAPVKAPGPNILWTEFDPIVILPTRNPALPVVLRAQASGSPQSLQLALPSGPTLTLLDNGVAPDTAAGDQIYAVNLPTPEILSRNVPERFGRPILGQLRPVVGGSPTNVAINIVGEVAPADLPAYPVTTRAGAPFDYRHTSHVVNYVDATFHADRNIENSVTRILPRIGDRHDFVDVLSLQRRYVENRFHGGVRNDVTGIGLNLFDSGAAWGSPARLRGFSMFPTLGFYDPQARAYNHEVGHQWINFLLGALDDTQGAHWPVGPLAHFVMGTSGDGFQGIETSCLLTRNGGTVTGTFQLNSRSFGPYELYLMGLLPPAQVPASWQFTDQAAARMLMTQPGWCNGTINLATSDVTLQTIVGANGVRSPAFGQSPRYFKVATLAVSVNRLLDDTEMRYLTWLAKRGDIEASLTSAIGLATETGMNFFVATGGRARLDFRLDAVFRDTFD